MAKNFTPIVIAIQPDKRAFFEAMCKRYGNKKVKKETHQNTKFNEQTVGALRTALQIGCTVEEACRSAHIHRDTFYGWKERYPDFSDMVDEWMDNPVLMARATIYKAMNDKDTARWFLERKKKKEFSTRQEITGAEGKELLPILQGLDTDNYGSYRKGATATIGQVVENEPPVQDQDESGGDSDVQTELRPDEAHNPEGGASQEPDPES